MATTKIPVPKPGEGEPIVYFDIQLGGKWYLTLVFKFPKKSVPQKSCAVHRH